MNFHQIIINLILIITTLLISYLFKSFWPKYFETKGANQATKEDIGEITEIIENIKANLLQQNELLKLRLSFQNQHRLNIKTAEREAIFNFNRQISAWFYSLLRFTFYGYSLDNYKDIKKVVLEFSRRQYECDLAEAQLALFVRDQDFKNLKRDLIISIIRLQNMVERTIHEIYHSYYKYENYSNRNIKELEKLTETVRAIEIAHIEDREEHYKNINSFQVKMTDYINNRLKQLEDNHD